MWYYPEFDKKYSWIEWLLIYKKYLNLARNDKYIVNFYLVLTICLSTNTELILDRNQHSNDWNPWHKHLQERKKRRTLYKVNTWEAISTGILTERITCKVLWCQTCGQNHLNGRQEDLSYNKCLLGEGLGEGSFQKKPIWQKRPVIMSWTWIRNNYGCGL